jgi:pimeloyl-ACP methyl ester carboxylesterase
MFAATSVAAKEHTASAAEAATRYARVGDARIAYRRLGSGAPLLLATRFRGTIDTWDPAFLDALARHHDVIVFDFPGIGHSSGVQPDTMEAAAASIGDLADALELERFALLGWSRGGLVAQAYLLDHPQRVTQAVLLATNPPGHNAIPLQPAFLERALKPVNDLADEEVLFFEPESELSRERAAQSRARIQQRDGVDARIPSRQEQFDRYFHAAGGFHEDIAKRRERLQQIATPILVLCGDNDTSTAGQNWFPLIGTMRNAQFVFYSETGHAPQHQQPEVVAEAITRFLAQQAQSMPTDAGR